MDQVIRLERFRRQRPEVDIRHHREPGWHWEAVWRDEDGTTTVVADRELSALLDQLETALP